MGRKEYAVKANLTVLCTEVKEGASLGPWDGRWRLGIEFLIKGVTYLDVEEDLVGTTEVFPSNS